MKSKLRRLFIIVMLVSISLSILEISLQIISTDYDSYVVIGDNTLRLNPQEYRIHLLETAVTNYEQRYASANQSVIYDPHTGWRPKYNSHDALYTWNSAGMRDNVEYEKTPPTDALRIALFGDSFITGWEVFDDETIGYYLEKTLLEQGIKAEVLNFGYGGYGMDQAYLRWKYYGQEYNPDIVIFGFQPENMFRNFNIFRHIYPTFATQSPFTKPRFVLDEKANLHMINHPALTPQDGLGAFHDLNNHYLYDFEDYYDYDYNEKWWLRSKIALLIYQNHLLNQPRSYEQRHMDLAHAIIKQFANEVEEQDSDFILVYLPNKPSMNLIHKKESLPFQPLLDQLKDSYFFIDSAPALRLMNGGYWAVGGHYAPENNRAIARNIANRLSICIESKHCIPHRLQDVLSGDNHED